MQLGFKLNILSIPENDILTMTPDTPESQISSRQPSRRLAREIDLRAIYVMEIRGCNMEEALNDPLVSPDSNPPAYTVRVLSHMERYREQLDDVIRAKVERWEFHRIAVIDRLILRMAIAEMLYLPDVPPKVTINEAIEIAKTFSTPKSGRFVNGILDAVFNDMQEGQLN